MERVMFTDSEKIACFDEIAAHFYACNFGHFSKTDMELLMFHFYMEKMIAANQRTDGTIDYNTCSDYKISRDLGITQQKVRNLKVKNHLERPISFDWKAALSRLMENARYDSHTGRVILNIADPILYEEIQNAIEENGGYVDKQRNGKVLQLRAEYFIDLAMLLEPDASRRAVAKACRKTLQDAGKVNAAFDERRIGKSLLDAAVNITEIAANLSTIFSPGNSIWQALGRLLQG